MQTVLLIESDVLHAQSIQTQIGQELEIDIEVATTMEAARKRVEELAANLLAVVVNLRFCLHNYSPFENVPTIVVTEGIPLEPRRMFAARHVIDYIADYRGHNLDYLLQLLKRVKFAKQLKILVVDDQKVVRNLIRTLLTNKGFYVIEAEDGMEALQLLKKHPDTKLLIVDNHMPRMDGFALIQKLRLEHSKSQLCIIGMAGDENEYDLVRFLRFGANDCIVKPFNYEEFHVRVMQNLQLIEVFQEIADLSRRDHLTNLFNRKHFYDVAHKIYENYRRGTIEISVAMIDIDNFKRINDTHGHRAGDQVLVSLAQTLTTNLRTTDVIARFGGEEFCVLSTGLTAPKGRAVFERIRRKIAESRVETANATLHYTVSIGLTSQIGESLDDMINQADALLYEAKEAGRNRVVAR